MLATLPAALNSCFPGLEVSGGAYGTKLAVATAGCGSKYPKHVDNSGLPDQRKLTMIYYLNPAWEPADAGELRLFLPEPAPPLDLSPVRLPSLPAA